MRRSIWLRTLMKESSCTQQGWHDRNHVSTKNSDTEKAYTTQLARRQCWMKCDRHTSHRDVSLRTNHVRPIQKHNTGMSQSWTADTIMVVGLSFKKNASKATVLWTKHRPRSEIENEKPGNLGMRPIQRLPWRKRKRGNDERVWHTSQREASLERTMSGRHLKED